MHRNPLFESLESRCLLSFEYSMIDLGVVDQPLGSAVLDLNDSGVVLTPTAMWVVDAGKGKKTDIDPAQFIARKLGTKLSATGALTFNNQAAKARIKHGRLRLGLIGPITLQTTSIGNAVGLSQNTVGRMKGSGAFHAFVLTGIRSNGSPAVCTDLTAELRGRGLEINNAIDMSMANQILLSGHDSDSGLAGAGIATLTSRGIGFVQLTGTGKAGEEVLPREINDIGQAAGVIRTDGIVRSVIWSTSRHGVQIVTIPGLGGNESEARGLNNLGLVVGFSTMRSGEQRAMLFDGSTGKTADLNRLADTLGLTLRVATSVNNSGQIAGEGVDAKGQVHAVLLTPTNPYPELVSGVTLDSDHRLNINGTPRADKIDLRVDSSDQQRLTVTLNGKESLYGIYDVRAVRIHGGRGNDAITVSAPRAFFPYAIYGDGGDDAIAVANQDDVQLSPTIYGGEGDDQIAVAGERCEFLVSGDGGNDQISAESGYNTLWGGAGDDLIQTALAANIRGENGNDTIVGSSLNDSISGGNGDDSISSLAGDDAIQGGNGNDWIDAGDGTDNVMGGNGNDYILGGNGDDYVYGDRGSDTILGQSGDDTLAGDIAVTRTTINPTHEAGNDLIMGGRGRDYLLGSTDLDPGRDTLWGQEKGDIINGRSGDLLADANADDIVPRATTAGKSPFAVDNTAVIELRFPAIYPASHKSDHTLSAVSIPVGAGDFSRSPFFLESAGTLRMRSHVSRDFTIGEFFDNWGIYVDARHFGGYVAPPPRKRQSAAIFVNNQPFSRDLIIGANDAIVIEVRV
jgi:probable HAF family extracellular repeat protein